MRVLLDTHAWLWMLVSPERFSRDARALVADGTNDVLLSAASSREIAIKSRWASSRCADLRSGTSLIASGARA
ncbi:hypothetical protein BH23ACT8_BH23ACT8_23160 [soil metagenome]